MVTFFCLQHFWFSDLEKLDSFDMCWKEQFSSWHEHRHQKVRASIQRLSPSLFSVSCIGLLKALVQMPTCSFWSVESCSVGGFRGGNTCFHQLWSMRNLRTNFVGGTTTCDMPTRSTPIWYTCWLNQVCHYLLGVAILALSAGKWRSRHLLTSCLVVHSQEHRTSRFIESACVSQFAYSYAQLRNPKATGTTMVWVHVCVVVRLNEPLCQYWLRLHSVMLLAAVDLCVWFGPVAFVTYRVWGIIPLEYRTAAYIRKSWTESGQA